MLKNTMLTIAFFLPMSLLANAEFGMRLVPMSKIFPQGAPIQIAGEVFNDSGHDLLIAHGVKGWCIAPDVRSESGLPLPPCLQEQKKQLPGNTSEVLPPTWKQQFSFPICATRSGKYFLRVRLTSIGPYLTPKGEAFSAWSGVCESEEIEFEIIRPEGIDKQAYDFFQGNPLEDASQLLSLFPTAIYSGFALVDGLSAVDLQYHASITSEGRDRFMHVPQGASIMQQREWRQNAKKKEEAKLDTLGKYIRARPDFPQIDKLYKQAAILLFVLDRPQEAWLEVETLAKLDGPWAEEARKVLKDRNRDATPSSQTTAPTAPSMPPPAPPIAGPTTGGKAPDAKSPMSNPG